MFEFAKIYYYIFGAITLIAAIQGAVAGSMISLIAGGVLGLLILAGAFLLPTKATVALTLALIGAIGIAGKFVPGFLKKHTLWPDATLAALSIISIVVTVVAFTKK